MTWLKKSLALLLLALWVPATVHCTLATLPGFSFLQTCCDDTKAAQTPGPCDEDSCGEVESGSYRIEDDPAVTPDLAVLVTLAAWDCFGEPSEDSARQLGPATSAPPGLFQYWQFSYRTALPPRAPSLIG